MKKILIVALLQISLGAMANTRPAEVNEKVLKAFHQTFGSASDVVWHEIGQFFQANFRQGEIQVKAQYSADGGLLRTMRYYGEGQLLPHIVSKLRKKYSAKEIFGVTEISTENDLRFIIVIRDEKNWYMVQSDAMGNLEQTEKYKRADN